MSELVVILVPLEDSRRWLIEKLLPRWNDIDLEERTGDYEVPPPGPTARRWREAMQAASAGFP